MDIAVTYGQGFEPVPAPDMRTRVLALQADLARMPQYEPVTRHYFHAGMYCREVWRKADVTIVGKVHKKEHFYLIVSGTVHITTDDGVQKITGPRLIECTAGTKRAVFSETDALCMTFHIVAATTVDEAEAELVEAEESAFGPGNLIKNENSEVLP